MVLRQLHSDWPGWPSLEAGRSVAACGRGCCGAQCFCGSGVRCVGGSGGCSQIFSILINPYLRISLYSPCMSGWLNYINLYQLSTEHEPTNQPPTNHQAPSDFQPLVFWHRWGRRFRTADSLQHFAGGWSSLLLLCTSRGPETQRKLIGTRHGIEIWPWGNP